MDMSGLRWLKLNKTSLAMLPDELSSLSKLVRISVIVSDNFKLLEIIVRFCVVNLI